MSHHPDREILQGHRAGLERNLLQAGLAHFLSGSWGRSDGRLNLWTHSHRSGRFALMMAACLIALGKEY